MKFEKLGNRLFQWRGKLPFPFVLMLLVFLTPQYPIGSHWLDGLTDIIGCLFMLAGLALRVLVVGYRKSGTSGRSREIKTSELTTDGAYAYVRNPLYLGNIVIAFGVMIIFLNPWLFLVLLTYLLHYYLIIRAEEEYLTQRFGEAYLSYKRGTPRLIPGMGKGKRNPPARKFDWNQVARKEKNLFLGVILAPIFMEIYEEILHEGWRLFLTHDFGELVINLMVANSAFLLWLLMTYQKKRRTI
jgi:protein-S-isoprenylcysteine O-methyltransferase Ste14